jgi:hypothetical protein
VKLQSIRSAPGERGFAMIAILSLAALVSAFLIASALNPSAAGVSSEREQRSMNALRQAKAALIAYAASEQWQMYKSQPSNQPGGLPCPDADDDGSSEGATCSSALSRIGRLPWATIGTQDLRDASGERLWYAVSSNFRRLSGTTRINSDTQGLLTVTGAAPASNVVAVVIGPGDSLSGQDRQLQHNNYLAYLEGVTLDSPVSGDSTFNTVGLPTAAGNDRLMVITQAELMAAVEPVVAARIERDIKPYIREQYFADWGIFPFAAPFADPDPGRDQNFYTGNSGLTDGLLPLTSDTSFAGWDTSSITVTQIPPGTGSSTVTSVDCSSSTGSQIVCQIDYSGGSGDRPDIRLQATLKNVARSFLRPAAQSDKSMTDRFGDPANWSSQGSPPLAPTVSSALLGSGHATVTYIGRLYNAATTSNRVFITVSAPYYPIVSSTDPQAGWFIANRWYRQTYYAVAPGFVLGGSGSCSAGGTCLRVNNLPASYAPSDNKRSILVFAGRALDGSIRPTNNLANYLEAQNATPADGLFQHHPFGLPTTINDRVVVVSPP